MKPSLAFFLIAFHGTGFPAPSPREGMLSKPDPPSLEQLTEDTRVTLADDDAGPTKAWLVSQRNNPRWRDHYQLAYGKRPREELYALASDPHQLKNVAADPQYAKVRAELEKRLMIELKRTADPRVVDDGRFFETPPMSGPVTE